MTTIDLSRPAPPPESLLDALPRRVTLTLPELRLVAELAGGAPLPFDVAEPAEQTSLEDRLGVSRGTSEDRAYRAALDALHDPRTSLSRRGLLVDGTLDRGLAGAVGLLATPEVALDLDVATDDVRVKAWHRQGGDAVASLATCDGIVFELAWFPLSAWTGELSRVAVLPEDLPLRASRVPAHLDLPYELVDGAVEAVAGGRADLVPVLVGQHSGAVLDEHDRPLPDAEASAVLGALGSEARGRLRALVADVSREVPIAIGVRSWVLLADGWRSLTTHEVDGVVRVVVRDVDAPDLAADLAPVLAEVSSS